MSAANAVRRQSTASLQAAAAEAPAAAALARRRRVNQCSQRPRVIPHARVATTPECQIGVTWTIPAGCHQLNRGFTHNNNVVKSGIQPYRTPTPPPPRARSSSRAISPARRRLRRTPRMWLPSDGTQSATRLAVVPLPSLLRLSFRSRLPGATTRLTRTRISADKPNQWWQCQLRSWFQLDCSYCSQKMMCWQ